MALVHVDVMLKPEILDPQGQAVLGALGRTGHPEVTSVRQGKHFEIALDGLDGDDALAEARRIADSLLANPVIEEFTLRLDR